MAKQQRPSLGSLSSLPSDAAEPDPNYRATIEWVWSFSARPRSVEDVTRQRAVKLERMYDLLTRLGHPEAQFPTLLVAGTKGKGSTVAMLSACLRAAGYRTGRYTSPHLVNWRERTCVDGEPISTQDVIGLSGPIKDAIDQIPPSLGSPTTFEVGTAFAFLRFARQNVDVAVVEVGTGGRFDATNLADISVAVIAPISYDHTQTLGTTLTSIAWHKSGIMRVRRPAVSAPQPVEARQVIEAEAKRLDVPLEEVGREWRWRARDDRTVINSSDGFSLDADIALLGDHQRDNATCAVAALRAISPRFRVPDAAIQVGLSNVDWPGRLQVLSQRPLLVIDGAHNAASADVLGRAVEHTFGFDRLLLVVGLSEGKDALGVLGSLAPRAARVYLTRSQHERSARPSDLEPLVRSAAPGAAVSMQLQLADALGAALADAQPDDMVLVTGSLFLVGETLDWWRHSSR